jgi:hypothetical protein
MAASMASVRVKVWAAVAVLLAAGSGTTGPAAGAAEPAPVRDIRDFACPPDLASDFTDIAGSVHAFAITCLTGFGITEGVTPTTYAPARPVTRGQMATFLARTLQNTGVELDTSEQGFVDDEGSVHQWAINGLAALGVVQGTGPGTFSPSASVTRAQMASFLVRMLALATAPPAGPDAFRDDDGTTHEAAINTLAALGVVQGIEPGRYGPSQPVTRAAMASFLMRLNDWAIERGILPPGWVDDVLVASLSGTAVVPGPGDGAASGDGWLLDIGIPGTVCFDAAVDMSSDAVALDLRRGAAGVEGELVLTLWEAGNEALCIRTDPGTLDAVFSDPGAHHLQIRSVAHPAGAVRGQLGRI